MVSAILTAHFIGDFILQSRDMAANKGKSFKTLLKHCLLYIGPIFGVSAIYLSFPSAMMYACINFLLHFLVDAISSQLTERALKRFGYYHFFAVIGLDQLIHSIILINTISERL